MLESYEDIRKRIPEEPKWFDHNGVPRYDDFHPSLSPDVYADEVVLFEIACQSCGAKFLVEESWNFQRDARRGVSPLSSQIREKTLHYGDPPCWECPAGATMNCIDVRTVQSWSRVNTQMEWGRNPELEGLPLEDADTEAR